MLFNSYVFLLAFLPVTLVGYFLAGRHGRTPAIAWLVLASFVFYGWWDWRYIPLLLLSILFNFFLGSSIARHAGGDAARRQLIVGVAVNLGLLGFFKYADFFIGAANAVSGSTLPLLHVVLPIGISFYTFTQIAFLVDASHGEVREYRLVHYALFVTYFPHLIAGPILHHKEMMPQFDRAAPVRPEWRNFEIGFSFFAIGLGKKVLLADSLAPFANAAFASPDGHTLLTAWLGVLAYGLQLYFDFSGYSDMAIGLSRLFGIKLPLNFDSPYKSRNISEFWRRWHMTLSRFLRDYLYVPLGGNRRGPARRYLNLFVTMGLGGLWHGAGWGFVVWGLLHGFYLSVHHAWSALRGGVAKRAAPLASRGHAAGSVALTFLAVTIAWTFFRAPHLQDALSIVAAMSGAHGVALPDALLSRLGPLTDWLTWAGVRPYLGGGTQFVQGWAWVIIAASIAFLAPNSQEIMRRGAPGLTPVALRPMGPLGQWLTWRRRPRWAVGLAMLSAACVLSMSNPTEFLYFQF